MKVVITNLGDYWLEDYRAVKIAKLMISGNQPVVDIDGSIIAINQIKGVLTAHEYKTIIYTRKRNWACQHGSTHGWRDGCGCSQPTLAAKQFISSTKTPEQEQHETDLARAQSAWISKFKQNLKHKDFRNRKKREEFVLDFLKKL